MKYALLLALLFGACNHKPDRGPWMTKWPDSVWRGGSPETKTYGQMEVRTVKYTKEDLMLVFKVGYDAGSFNRGFLERYGDYDHGQMDSGFRKAKAILLQSLDSGAPGLKIYGPVYYDTIRSAP